jgi:hypothetical protein
MSMEMKPTFLDPITPENAVLSLIDQQEGMFRIDRADGTPQLATLWTHFNGGAVMTTFLLIYIIGHLLSAVLIGIMLGRLRLIPAWAAWAFALTSPLTVIIILVHIVVFQGALKYLICVL